MTTPAATPLTEAFMDRLRGENVPGHQSPAALLLLGHAEQMERERDEARRLLLGGAP